MNCPQSTMIRLGKAAGGPSLSNESSLARSSSSPASRIDAPLKCGAVCKGVVAATASVVAALNLFESGVAKSVQVDEGLFDVSLTDSLKARDFGEIGKMMMMAEAFKGKDGESENAAAPAPEKKPEMGFGADGMKNMLMLAALGGDGNKRRRRGRRSFDDDGGNVMQAAYRAKLGMNPQLRQLRQFQETRGGVSARLMRIFRKSRRYPRLAKACEKNRFIEEEASTYLSTAAAVVPRGVPILFVDSHSAGSLRIHICVAFNGPNPRNPSWLRSVDFVEVPVSKLVYDGNRLLRLDDDASSLEFIVDESNVDSILQNLLDNWMYGDPNAGALVKELFPLKMLSRSEKVDALQDLDRERNGALTKALRRHGKSLADRYQDMARRADWGLTGWQNALIKQHFRGDKSMMDLMLSLPMNDLKRFGRYRNQHRVTGMGLRTGVRAVTTECSVNSLGSQPVPTVLCVPSLKNAKDLMDAIRIGSRFSGDPVYT